MNSLLSSLPGLALSASPAPSQSGGLAAVWDAVSLSLIHIYLDPYGDVLVSPAPAVDHGRPLAPQAEGGPCLGAGGQVVLHLAVNGVDLQLCA